MIEFRTRRQRHPLIKDSQRRCAFGNRRNRCVRATKCFRYYNSDSAMWSNRDPIEEDGGINLYSIADNQPTLTVDRLGLSKCPFADPCKEYFRQNPKSKIVHGLAREEQLGLVVCCGGILTACAAPPDSWEWFSGEDPHALRLRTECVLELEEFHAKDPDMECPKGGRCGDTGVSKAQATNTERRHTSECLAHLIEWRCLKSKKSECPTPYCRSRIEEFMKDAWDNAEENCKKVGLW